MKTPEVKTTGSGTDIDIYRKGLNKARVKSVFVLFAESGIKEETLFKI
jgi:hypothetical protein